MNAFMMDLWQLFGKHLHEFQTELFHELYFFGVVQVFLHFLFIEFLYVHEDGVVKFFYHQRIYCLAANRQSVQNVFWVDHVEISEIRRGSGEESSLGGSGQKLFDGGEHGQFVKVYLKFYLDLLDWDLKIELDELVVDGGLRDVRVSEQYEPKYAVERLD